MIRSASFDLGWVSRHRMFLYGAATVWVIMSHLLTRFGDEIMLGVPAWLQKRGMCGVEMFLLLSGFGLYHSLSAKPDVMRFYGRRLSRVFLPAFIVAAVYCAVNYVSLQDMIYSVTMLPYFFTNRSFWYVAFILVMYAVYPAIYGLQRRSAAAAWLVCAAVSVTALAAVMATNCEVYLQRAVTRVPVFLLGCLIAPWITERRRIPAWSAGAFVGAFAALEAARLIIAPESYALRAAAFIPLAGAALMLLAYLAELLVRWGKGKGLYRCAGFMGNISLETYLIFERMQDMLLRVRGYENPGRYDLMKTDIAALVMTLLFGYLLTLLCAMLRRDFAAVPVPQKDTHS